eukprot:COSAG02_NODE_44752_length_363_cov_0.875000_1_plen_46_part_10
MKTAHATSVLAEGAAQGDVGQPFFNDPATTEIYTIAYTLSLHDALP